MKPLSLLDMTAARARRWLRMLLLCSLFAALHGTLGAWTVSALNPEGAVQICTPQGLQWVALDQDATADGKEDAVPAGGSQVCVWAGAQVAMTPGLNTASLPVPPPVFRGSGRSQASGLQLAEHAQRVLLMSAMRAPPARWC